MTGPCRTPPEKTIVMHDNGSIVSIPKEGDKEIIVRLSYGSKELTKQIFEFVKEQLRNE